MNIGIDLMIFCYQDEDMNKEEMGIAVPLKDCELRLFTFYTIDYISIDRENDDYTLIGCNGDEFICNEKYQVIKHKIEQINILRLN